MLKKLLPLATPLLAVTAALLLSALFIFATGRDPVAIYGKMFAMTLGSDYGAGQIVFRATTLVLTGLAVAIPFKVRLFNIGGEGQALAGLLAAAAAGTALPEGTPPLLAITFCSAAAVFAGGSVGLFAGWLKVRHGVNEVISTIMLNFIVHAFVGYMLTWHMAVPSTVHTTEIIESAKLPMLDGLLGIWKKSPANMSVLFALAGSLLCYIVLFRTRTGYEVRAVGIRPEAARYAGIDARWHVLGAMAAGGALAGLAATNLVLGYKHYYEAGLSGGAGFLGIAVALLANAHPLWITASAFLFGFLEYGGLTVNAYVPKDIFMIVQAITILMILALPKLPLVKRLQGLLSPRSEP